MSENSKSNTRSFRGRIIFHSENSFLRTQGCKPLLHYRYFPGKLTPFFCSISSNLYSSKRNALPTESTQSHFLCISNIRRKFNSAFLLRRCNRLTRRCIPEHFHFDLFKSRVIRYQYSLFSYSPLRNNFTSPHYDCNCNSLLWGGGAFEPFIV